MAFPTTGILENFTGTNGSLLDADWTTLPSANPPRITSNQAGNNGATGAYVGAYWDVEQFGPDSEAFLTIAVNADYIGLYARFNPVDSSGYQASWSGSNLTLVRNNTNGTETTLDSATLAKANGTKLGIECIGTAIKVYADTGSGWTEVLSATDSTFTAAGYIGWDMFDGSSVQRVDDFGGGDVVGGGGGTDHEQPVDDDLTAADENAKTVGKTQADSVTVTDQLARTAEYARTLADALEISDTAARTLTKVLADDLTVTDTGFGTQHDHTLTLDDDLEISDLLDTGGSTAHEQPADDDLEIADEHAKTFTKALSDTVEIADATSTVTEYARTLSDDLEVADQASVGGVTNWVVDIDDTVTVTDTPAKTAAITFADDLQAQDATSKALTVNLTETPFAQDALTREWDAALALTDAIEATDEFDREWSGEIRAWTYTRDLDWTYTPVTG